jgi:hypothetical protein
MFAELMDASYVPAVEDPARGFDQVSMSGR